MALKDGFIHLKKQRIKNKNNKNKFSDKIITEHDIMQQFFCDNSDFREAFHFIYDNNTDLIFSYITEIFYQMSGNL